MRLYQNDKEIIHNLSIRHMEHSFYELLQAYNQYQKSRLQLNRMDCFREKVVYHR